MHYCEIQIELDSSQSAFLSAMLCEKSLSFQQSDQSTLNAPPPGRTRFHLYIPAEERDQIPDLVSSLRQAVSSARRGPPAEAAEAGEAADAIVVEVRDRDDSEWRDTWKRFFATRRIGSLAIVPSWEAEQHTPVPGEVTLHMDPGRAFGTGGHESTRLCLRLLDQLHGKLELYSPHFAALSERLADCTPDKEHPLVLDVGCGSGVLAIAALRLWPSIAGLAIDLDPEAVDVTVENAERNQVLDRLRCETTPLQELSTKPADRFPIVLANLTGPTLIELAEPLAQRLAEGGVIIMSGILDSEANNVAARFLAQGLVETARATEDEWAALQYVRPRA